MGSGYPSLLPFNYQGITALISVALERSGRVLSLVSCPVAIFLMERYFPPPDAAAHFPQGQDDRKAMLPHFRGGICGKLP